MYTWNKKKLSLARVLMSLISFYFLSCFSPHAVAKRAKRTNEMDLWCTMRKVNKSLQEGEWFQCMQGCKDVCLVGHLTVLQKLQLLAVFKASSCNLKTNERQNTLITLHTQNYIKHIVVLMKTGGGVGFWF